MEDEKKWGLVYFPYMREWQIVWVAKINDHTRENLKYKDLTWEEAKALLVLLKESEDG